jgi:hypothetical protein
VCQHTTIQDKSNGKSGRRDDTKSSISKSQAKEERKLKREKCVQGEITIATLDTNKKQKKN